MTHEYKITGMTCGSCVARVKSELLKIGDVLAADIRLQSPQATISMSKHITTPVLQQAVSKAGHYTITEMGQGHEHPVSNDNTADRPSYFPIFLIFGFITGVTILVQVAKDSFSWMQWMTHFMSGFFFVFSFFKMMNLKGFAEGYSSYDVVAKRVRVWGYIYPFIELGLAIAFLMAIDLFVTNVVTLLVMGVSTAGVIQSLIKKTPFQCACLGTVIKLPLSKVTLFEDLLMVAMSAIMIFTML
ncbi:MAG: heavy-metal-associated domain-containing protein [Chitinophagaceae bacterium]|nr:heavy-metal-associated domain-containing protein [Chitinophagaceae bacterium]